MHLTYCTVEEIAKKWGISARSVRNYCTEGRIADAVLDGKILKNGHTPFIVTDDIKRFYYLGLEEWRQGRRERLHDVFGTGQDMFRLGLAHFGYGRLAQNREL